MTIKNVTVVVAAIIIAVGFTFNSLSAREKVKHNTKLIMTLSGIPVGKAYLSMKLDNGAYAMHGSAKAYGASKIFSNAKGVSTSRGRYDSGRIVAASHELKYSTKKMKGTVKMTFDGSGLQESHSVPPVFYQVDSVKLQPAHLRAVLDPVSTSIVAVKASQIGNGTAICNRTLPIYDGKKRFDLRLRFKGIRKLVTKGFKGISYVCSARYVPVAGHRPHKKHIKRLIANRSIEVAMARIGTTPVYGLIQFAMKTRYGRIAGRPSYFHTTAQ